MPDNKQGKLKIKEALPQFKNTEVKKNGSVVRKMTVRRKFIFRASKQKREY